MTQKKITEAGSDRTNEPRPEKGEISAEMLRTEVSFYASFFDNEPISRALRDVANLAMSESIRKLTLDIRRLRAIANDKEAPIDQALEAKNKADKLKKSLPSFLTDVYCEHGKKRSDIIRFLPFAGYDVDHLTEEEVMALMGLLVANPHVVIAEPSCSRTGVHFMVLTDAADWLNAQWDGKDIKPYEYVWHQAKEYVEGAFNIAIDVKCMNPEHIFGICYDEMVHCKENPVPLHIDTSKYAEPVAKAAVNYGPNAVSGTYQASIYDVSDKIISRIEQSGIYFTEGSRNDFVLRFAFAANKYGVPQSETESFCTTNFAQSDFKDNEIIATIRSAYGKTAEHGTFSADVKEASDSIAEKSIIEPVPVDGLTSELEAKLMKCVMDRTASYPENEFLFAVDGVPVITKDDIHTLGAKQKGGKTTLVKILLAACVCGRWNRISCNVHTMNVLYIDTEMKIRDTFDLNTQVARLAEVDMVPDNIQYVNFRPLSVAEMRIGIPFFIAKYQPQLVFIDGIVDLCANFNDVEASQDLVINYLMKIAEEHHCAIINILHTNKTDGYSELRGHLGAFFEQKGSTVIRCEKDENTNIVTVKFPTHRYAPVPEFHFTFADDGMPVCADAQHHDLEEARRLQDREKKEAEKQKVFNERSMTILTIVRNNGGQIERAKLMEMAKEAIGKGDSTVKGMVKQMLECNPPLIIQNDRIICLPE